VRCGCTGVWLVKPPASQSGSSKPSPCITGKAA
jgi:hypothetical protein